MRFAPFFVAALAGIGLAWGQDPGVVAPVTDFSSLPFGELPLPTAMVIATYLLTRWRPTIKHEVVLTDERHERDGREG